MPAAVPDPNPPGTTIAVRRNHLLLLGLAVSRAGLLRSLELTLDAFWNVSNKSAD
jgi:hypothetical protein